MSNQRRRKLKKIEPFRVGIIATSTDLMLQGMLQKLNETIESTNEIVDEINSLNNSLNNVSEKANKACMETEKYGTLDDH